MLACIRTMTLARHSATVWEEHAWRTLVCQGHIQLTTSLYPPQPRLPFQTSRVAGVTELRRGQDGVQLGILFDALDVVLEVVPATSEEATLNPTHTHTP